MHSQRQILPVPEQGQIIPVPELRLQKHDPLIIPRKRGKRPRTFFYMVNMVN